MKAYWVSDNGLAKYGMGTKTSYVVRPEPYIHNGAVVPCESGFHASPDPWHAFSHIGGCTMDLVELGGVIVPHGDPINKYAASERTHLKRIKTPSILLEFTRHCALDATRFWHCPAEVTNWLSTGKEVPFLDAILEEAYRLADRKSPEKNAIWSVISSRRALHESKFERPFAFWSFVDAVCSAHSRAVSAFAPVGTTDFRAKSAEHHQKFNALFEAAFNE